MRFCLLFSLLFCLVFRNLSAQEDSLSSKMSKLGIGEIIEGKSLTEDKIIGASRSARKLEDLPLTVHVITQEEILANGYTTLVDALKMVPGIRTAKIGTGQAGEQFMLRGLEGNLYTKILLNSLPIQPSSDGMLGIGEQLPITQVERIEVIYGASSAIYGADAMAGVINIITKTPQSSNFTQVNVHTGQFGYRHVNFFAGGKVGKGKNTVQFQVMGNFGSRDDINVRHKDYKRVWSPLGDLPYFDGWTDEQLRGFLNTEEGKRLLIWSAAESPYFQDDLINPKIGKLPHQSYMYGANVKFRNFNFFFHEMYREDHSSLGRRPIVFNYKNPETKIGDKQQIYGFNYSFSLEKLTFTANALYQRARYNPFSSYATNYHNNGRSYLYQASDDIFAEALINYNFSKKFELTSGVSYKIAGAMPATRDLTNAFDENFYKPFSKTVELVDIMYGDFGIHNKTISNLGAFVQGFYSPNRWNLIASIRFDAPSNYGWQLYQRLAALFKLSPKTTLRVSGGFAFKAPTLFASYYSLAILDRVFDPSTLTYGPPTGLIAYQLIPNPNLKPEQSRTLEMGLRRKITDDAYFDASLFSNIVSNRIVTKTVPIDKEKYYLAVNDETRSYFNDSLNITALSGLQTTFRARNLIPEIALNLNLTYTWQAGFEDISGKGTIRFVREVPSHSFQAGLSFKPYRKLYINLDFVAFSSWYKRYFEDTDINDAKSLARAKINGFSTLDMTTRWQFAKSISGFVKILNVFDARYGGINATGFDIDLRYTPQPGRNIHLGISINMN